jgi:hypothetical protein
MTRFRLVPSLASIPSRNRLLDRASRLDLDLLPHVRPLDSLVAEFPAYPLRASVGASHAGPILRGHWREIIVYVRLLCIAGATGRNAGSGGSRIGGAAILGAAKLWVGREGRHFQFSSFARGSEVVVGVNDVMAVAEIQFVDRMPIPVSVVWQVASVRVS